MRILQLCCNDPDNGNFTGRVSAVEAHGLKLASRTWDWGPKLTVGDGFIRIGGMKLRGGLAKSSYGNWCWNAYRVESDDLMKLINWPKFREWFDVEEAPERVFTAYRAGRRLKWKRSKTQGGAVR
jgi:hypothetical protein